MPEIGPAPEGYQPTAAGSPSTYIWLGSLVRGEAGVSVEDLMNATDRDGYDNQPSFGSDDALYFVSAIDRVQTDVMGHVPGARPITLNVPWDPPDTSWGARPMARSSDGPRQ